MNATHSPEPAAQGSVEQIADQFDLLAPANRWLDDELHRLYACHPPLSQATVNRLLALGERMRPAAEVRDRLASLDPGRLMAGVRVWVDRQTAGGRETAAVRADRAWSGEGA